MGENAGQVRLIIDPKDGKDKPVPALLVANTFQRLQNILYYIVDELEGNQPRKAGDFPNSVKEKAELVIKDMRVGSAEAVLALSGTQTSLPGTETFGERAISIADEILQKVSSEDINFDISKLIKSKLRQERVIRELEEIWPDEESRYNIHLGFGKRAAAMLDPSHKSFLKELLPKPPENVEKIISGRLMELRVDQKRSFQVDTVDGLVTCSYAPELENKVVENIGRLVRIRGTMKLGRGGKYMLSLCDASSLEDLKMLPLYHVMIKGKTLNLHEPLLLEVSYEEDIYLVSNDRFHLRGSGPTLKAAIEDLYEEIELLWEDYVEVGLEELSEDALDLRGELRALLGRAEV